MRLSARRGRDRGPEPIERRACSFARRNGDDDGLGLLKCWLEPRFRLGAVEPIGLDAIATQGGDGLGGPAVPLASIQVSR